VDLLHVQDTAPVRLVTEHKGEHWLRLVPRAEELNHAIYLVGDDG